MIKYFLAAFSFFATSSCISQDAKIVEIAKQASKSSLEKNLYALASDKMEGRLMGTRGDSIASAFIADWFKQHKLKAPFNNGKSYTQPITVYRKKLIDAKLSIAGKNYGELDGWLFTLSSIESVQQENIPVNSLHAKGFASIGCAPCTRAIQDGEDSRAGRWWWELSQKECGLHSENSIEKNN